MNDYPRRKRLRLEQYDYSSPGAYFVTICTHEKRRILSDVLVGAIHESPVVKLTAAGICVQRFIEDLPTRYPAIHVDKYVIMPNHIHLLLSVADARAIRESPLQAGGKRSLLNQAIGYLKMNSSKQIHKLYPDLVIWQRAFHDHVIRGDADYREIWNYIDTNPARWREDRFYCE